MLCSVVLTSERTNNLPITKMARYQSGACRLCLPMKYWKKCVKEPCQEVLKFGQALKNDISAPMPGWGSSFDLSDTDVGMQKVRDAV